MDWKISGAFQWSYVWIAVFVLLIVMWRRVLWFWCYHYSRQYDRFSDEKFVLWGEHKDLPPGKIVALNGEAGDQVDTLASGVHYALWPWQYSVVNAPLTIIPENFIGVVESRDGEPLNDGDIIGKHVDCDMYQDARAFLIGGGQRGPQRFGDS